MFKNWNQPKWELGGSECNMLHLISRIFGELHNGLYFQRFRAIISSVIDITEWMHWHLITNHIRRREMSYWHMIFIHLSAQCASSFINLQLGNLSAVLDLHWTKNSGQGSQVDNNQWNICSLYLKMFGFQLYVRLSICTERTYISYYCFSV